jgi:superfamily II DNA or RNA helicase
MKEKDVEVELWKMRSAPIMVGGGAVYPYKQGWMEIGERTAKYPDEDGNTKFNLFRVIGNDTHKRILVPRNMVDPILPAFDKRERGVTVKFENHFKPRSQEQVRVVKEAVQLLAQGESFMLRAPTGFGKTYCTSAIIAGVGKKALVTVTREDIIEQWLKAFYEVLNVKESEVGFIAGDTCDTVGKKLVIAMVQSLAKEQRYPEHHFRDFGFALWDECHRIGSDFFSQSCFRVPAHLRMGVSATPRRKDGREEVLHAHIGPVRVYSNTAPRSFRVITQESPWHCPTEPKANPDGTWKMDKETNSIIRGPIAHTAGRCSHVTKMLMHNHARNRILLNFTATAYKAGRTVLLQSDFKDHLEMLASMLPSLGVPVTEISFYVGGLTSAQRDKAKTKRVRFATYQMTAEATDMPEVDTLVMCTPKSDVEQIVGRARRELEGKKETLIFDIQDRSSPVFDGYSDNRLRWYRTQGATIQVANVPAPFVDKQGKSITIAGTK